MEKDSRKTVVAVAESELERVSAPGAKSPNPRAYWTLATDQVLNEEQLAELPLFGPFVLWCIKRAGFGRNLFWDFETGLRASLPVTEAPELGDVVHVERLGVYGIVQGLAGSHVNVISWLPEGLKLTCLPVDHVQFLSIGDLKVE